MKILQVGLGNFGKRHLDAWHRLGYGDRLWIAEREEQKWGLTSPYRFPSDRLTRDFHQFLPQVDVVDIVTPTQSHYGLCREALGEGKDVFLEKPMTLTSGEGQGIADLAEKKGLLVQVGFYYRFHPASERLKRLMEEGALGGIRYLSGNFMGFKRARTDVGVTHTDGIHFLDLFNWFLEARPVEVYAVCRDHFGRGLEDFSVVLLSYPDGTVAKVESGYIQPGRWKDKVVAGAMTSKELMVVGSRASAEIDFETETLTLHDAHHEKGDGIWTARVGESSNIPVPSCDPVQMVCRELESFLSKVQGRQPARPGPVEGGVDLALLMECIYESARSRLPVRLPALVRA